MWEAEDDEDEASSLLLPALCRSKFRKKEKMSLKDKEQFGDFEDE